MVRTNNSIEVQPRIIYANVKPSLFKTKKNAKYIIAEPGSWRAIKNAGKKIIIKALSWFFIMLKLYVLSLNNFASASTVNTLVNSDDWIPILPNRYHELGPWISVQKKNKPINESNDKTKKILAKCWKNLALIKRINIISGTLNKIHRSCLLYFVEKSKIWILPSE